MTKTPLLALVRKFFETDLVAAAHSLETMDEQEAVAVLKSLPASVSSQVIPLLPVTQSASLLKALPADLFRQIIEILDPHTGASIFVNLPADIRDQFLTFLSERTKKEIQDLLNYPLNSAGRLMTTDFIAFHLEVKVKDAIQKIRLLSKTRAPHSYVYVLDSDNRLIGNLNMRDLLLAPGEATLDTIMRKDVFSVNAFEDRNRIAEELSKQRFFAAPVIDAENRLLGVIRTDQLIEDAQAEASEDLVKMFGAGEDERSFSHFNFAIRKRLPWLLVNLGTAFLAASVVSLFESIIAKFTILAIFLPVVAGQGGNAGAQSLAVVMRGLVMHEIPASMVWKSIRKEAGVGAFNGLVVGVVTGLTAWVWHGSPTLGLVIALAMWVNMIAAGFSGAAIPLFMKALGRDPAQSSSIILTTVTDIVGFLSFLGFAVLFQNKLS